MKKVFLFTNIFPHYRKNLWEKLISSKNFNIEIFYDINDYIQIKNLPKSTIPSGKYGSLNYIKNYYLFRRILVWQSGVLSKIIFRNYDTLILLGEASCISTWITSIIAKLRKKKIIFWGHGLYGNESFFKKLFRTIFLNLPTHNLVYESRSKKLLIKAGFNSKKISVIYNSLDYDNQLKKYKNLKKKSSNNIFNNQNPILLFIGRLTYSKKINLLIDVANKLNEKYDLNLLIIGNGPTLNKLEKLSKKLINQGKCIFYGECHDEDILSELIFNSDLTVSPGNVGLTAIHSLSYGTPVCTHSNFNNQMPEVEAIIDGENGFFFEENNTESMLKSIDSWLLKSSNNKKDLIRKVVDDFYNTSNQLNIITEVVA